MINQNETPSKESTPPSRLSPVTLSLMVARFSAICDEMATVLSATACSPNIKDRLDFSCALFDRQGALFAQAAHVPVHLGSMAFAMRDIVKAFPWKPNDQVIFNDPFLGGTHLPDVTLVQPFFIHGEHMGFVANRAHHAQIGTDVPGSMPLASHIDEEGFLIAPRALYREGVLDEAFYTELCRAVGSNTAADLAAQRSANLAGVRRIESLLEDQPIASILSELNAYGAAMARSGLASLPEGRYAFSDTMDGDGFGNDAVLIHCAITVSPSGLDVDFEGTSPAVKGNINCPLSVTAAAVFYAFRCLLSDDTPACAGVFDAISIKAPSGCLVNAERPSATAAGNVETSMRIVDVVLGALALALPNRIPAASQGTMNNVAMGCRGQDAWDYYETLGGGAGASAVAPGASAIQVHMTNTLNTPIEILEMRYPLQIVRYQRRRGSGGAGVHAGGDGLIRAYQFLEDTEVTLLTERRTSQPWGLSGGQHGQSGRNRLDGLDVGGKIAFQASKGQVLELETPGGGGWGETIHDLAADVKQETR
ncbi:MAG: hydantoinase B/oxoprolinase family protein [Pseudomonadales bacterium]